MKSVPTRIFAASLVLLLPSVALASTGEHKGRHARHSSLYTLAHRYGWGCDAVFGCYVGPIFGKGGKGPTYRCFDPGYGWHPCA